MIYTDIDEANAKIQELLTKLLRTSGSRVIVTDFIEGNVELLDIPVPFSDFLKEDETYRTIRSYCDATNREVEYNPDKTRFIFGYELSDLFNIYGSLKQMLIEMYKQEAGGEEFTRVGENLFWILKYTEKNLFKVTNPNWKVLIND